MSLSPRRRGGPWGSRFAWSLLLLVVAAQLSLIWAYPRLPTQDGPAHLYSAWAFRELAPANDSHLARYFERNPTSVYPNLAYPAFLAVGLNWFSPPQAEKLGASIHVIVFPLSFLFLLRRMGLASALPALLAVSLSLNFFFFMGFFNFLWSVSLALLILGLLWSSFGRRSAWLALVCNALLLSAYFVHLMGFAAACLGAGVCTLVAGRSNWLRALSSWLPAALAGLLLWPSSSGIDSRWEYFSDIGDRAFSLLTLRVATSFGGIEPSVAAVIGPLLLATVAYLALKRGFRGPDNHGRRALGLLAVLCFASSLAAPHAVGAGGFVDQRLALLAWIFTVATISTVPSLRLWTTLPAAALALAQVMYLSGVFGSVNRDLEEFLAGAERLPERAHVFTYTLGGRSSREVVDPMANSNSLYALALRGANFYHYQAAPRHSGHFPIRYTANGLERYPGERPSDRIAPGAIAGFAEYVAVWGHREDKIYQELTELFRYEPVYSSDRLTLLERPENDIIAQLAALRQRAEAGDFERLAVAVAELENPQTIRLPGFEARLVGVTPDHWSFGTRPIGLLVTNGEARERLPSVGLALAASNEDLPAAVFIDDGGGRVRYDFENAAVREVDLSPVAGRGRRLYVIWPSAAWRPGSGDTRRLGVKVLTPTGPGAEERALLAILQAIRAGPERSERRLLERRVLERARVPGGGGLPLGEDVLVVGSSPDYWTRGTSAAGIVVSNPGPSPKIVQLRLACLAEGADLPIVASVDDGELVRKFRFEKPGFQAITLTPVPPRSDRLFLVWTDRDWSPGGRDKRRLGVKLFPREGGPPI